MPFEHKAPGLVDHVFPRRQVLVGRTFVDALLPIAIGELFT
jgi:hypothetical protein